MSVDRPFRVLAHMGRAATWLPLPLLFICPILPYWQPRLVSFLRSPSIGAVLDAGVLTSTVQVWDTERNTVDAVAKARDVALIRPPAHPASLVPANPSHPPKMSVVIVDVAPVNSRPIPPRKEGVCVDGALVSKRPSPPKKADVIGPVVAVPTRSSPGVPSPPRNGEQAAWRRQLQEWRDKQPAPTERPPWQDANQLLVDVNSSLLKVDKQPAPTERPPWHDVNTPLLEAPPTRPPDLASNAPPDAAAHQVRVTDGRRRQWDVPKPLQLPEIPSAHSTGTFILPSARTSVDVDEGKFAADARLLVRPGVDATNAARAAYFEARQAATRNRDHARYVRFRSRGVSRPSFVCVCVCGGGGGLSLPRSPADQ